MHSIWHHLLKKNLTQGRSRRATGLNLVHKQIHGRPYVEHHPQINLAGCSWICWHCDPDIPLLCDSSGSGPKCCVHCCNMCSEMSKQSTRCSVGLPGTTQTTSGPSQQHMEHKLACSSNKHMVEHQIHKTKNNKVTSKYDKAIVLDIARHCSTRCAELRDTVLDTARHCSTQRAELNSPFRSFLVKQTIVLREI